MANKIIKHYGVPGMKWGVRKDYSKVKTLYRISKTADESHINDGYYTTSKQEAESFKSFVKNSTSVDGVRVFSMKIKLKDIIISPSEKEEVDIQLELLKDKKIVDIWSDALANNHMSQMTMWEKHQTLPDLQETMNYMKTQTAKDRLGSKYPKMLKQVTQDFSDAQQRYDKDRVDYKKNRIASIQTSDNKESLVDFSIAVFGSPELRKIYRETMISKGYNAVEDHWGQAEKRNAKDDELSSPSAIMILDKNIFKNTKVKELK